MKDYFIKLINYDQYENKLILKLIMEANEPEKPVQLMAHLLNSQQIWLNRCKGIPGMDSVLWPDTKVSALEQLINDNHQAWVNFLNRLPPGDINQIVSYTNSKGEHYDTKLVDILAHLINHGTHHRAQIGQHLKLAGLEKLPITDYIFYIRS